MRLTPLPRGHGLLPEHVRLTGLVSGAGAADGPVWVDVPEAIAGDVVGRLDPWLLWLLPHAFETQQELVLDGPVDAELLRNAHALMEIWSGWRPDRRPIAVRVEGADIPLPASAPGRRGRRTGLFFTAGVDSFFTLFHHDEAARADPAGVARPIDDLVYTWGFDIPLRQSTAFAAKRATLARIAGDTGKTLVTLVTNLRETGVRQPWGPVMHGPALGGVGVLLGPRWHTVLLSSTSTHGDTDPWGSTAITDPLLSTSATPPSRTARDTTGSRSSAFSRAIRWFSTRCTSAGKSGRLATAAAARSASARSWRSMSSASATVPPRFPGRRSTSAGWPTSGRIVRTSSACMSG
ncbi:MAG: hypothetical protein ACKO5R_00375 [Planctomycetaceae bacterium]